MPLSVDRRKLSVLMPLFNEEEFVAASIARVLAAPLPDALDLEIVVVDDGSSDGSLEIVERLQADNPAIVRLIRHPKNRGKGAAIRTAIENAEGEFAVIQDADLEYDPSDFPKLLEPLLAGRADVVFGSRFMVAGERRVLYYWHSLANKILTTLCNMASDVNLTDVETCYKAFRVSLVKSIPLRCDRFGIEPELTIKLAQRQVSMYETPISYHGRTYEEGKKIGLKDAIQAVLVIIRFWLIRDIYRESGPEILDTLSNTPNFNRWMADTIRPYLGARVLEMGAGIGNLSRNLVRGRARYIASDIDGEHLARLKMRLQHRPNVQICYCDLSAPDSFAGIPGNMDAVVCLNVLEHIQDDIGGLNNIRSILAPGGRAIILVPEGPSIYGTLDEVLGHFRRYTEQELTHKMQGAGFRLEKMIRFNRVSRPAWFVNGRILKKRTFSRFQLYIFDHLVWFFRRLDPLLPWKPNSIIAIGVKE
ncbi:MAG: glycosyltransferase [Acidobacteriota bacterium]|nr:glycosyltransferase [Acidobacteriota bacterium]